MANVALIEALAQRIEHRLLERVNDPQDFIDFDGRIDVDADSVFETAFYGAADDLTLAEQEVYFEVLLVHPRITRALDELPSLIQEVAEDAAAYHRAAYGTMDDRMRYLGLSRFDFI